MPRLHALSIAAPATLTALDLFCGAAGGWSLGLHRAGIETIAACELDPWRRQVFAHNNPAARMYADVRDLTAARLMADLGRLPDWIVGSPPCQDISSANTKRRGVGGKRSGLFFEAVRLVGEVRPHWVAFENSPSLRTYGADRVLAALEDLGYACWPLVVGAVHAGANHLRKRVWLVAHANEGSQSGLSIHDQMAQRVEKYDANSACSAGESERTRCLQCGKERTGAGSGIAALPFNGGPPALGRVDDGISGLLAGHRGLGKRCLSAYGDAVLPQITEAIARAILAVDASSACHAAGAPAGRLHGVSSLTCGRRGATCAGRLFEELG